MFRMDKDDFFRYLANANANRAQTRYSNPSHDHDRDFKVVEFESDEFRMFSYKIKDCPLHRTHDWTICPYVHPHEHARRRHPLKMPYVPLSCPDYHPSGGCPRGDACDLAHGVFEYWLHPLKYRTRMCHAGNHCNRIVCFFAHTPEQLRVGCMTKLPRWFRLTMREKLKRYHESEPFLPTSVASRISNTSNGQRLGMIGQKFNTPTLRWFIDIPSTSANRATTKELPPSLNLDFLESPRMSGSRNDYHNNDVIVPNNVVNRPNMNSDVDRMSGSSCDYCNNMMQNNVVNWANMESDVPKVDWMSGSSSDSYNNQIMMENNVVNWANVDSDVPNVDWMSGSSSNYDNSQALRQNNVVNRANVESDVPNVDWMPGSSSDYYNNQEIMQNNVVNWATVESDMPNFDWMSSSNRDYYKNQVMMQSDVVNWANVVSEVPIFDWVSDLLNS